MEKKGRGTDNNAKEERSEGDKIKRYGWKKS